MRKNIKTKSKNYKISYKWPYDREWPYHRGWSYPTNISASNIFEAINNLCDSKKNLEGSEFRRMKSAHRTSNKNGNQYWKIHFYPESTEKEFGETLYFRVTSFNEDYLIKNTNVYF